MIEVRSYSVFHSGAVFQQSATIAKPDGLTVGDFILFSAAMVETIDGFRALTKDSADPARFTDLLLDGHIAPGAKVQYLLDPVSSNEWSWWLGWKWADAADVAATQFQVDVLSGIFGGLPVGASEIDLMMIALTGFDAVTPFQDTGYENVIPGGIPVPLPPVTSGGGVTISDRTVVTAAGGIGLHSAWDTVANLDGTSDEEMLGVCIAISTPSLIVSDNGMADMVTYAFDGGSSFYLGRGTVPKTLTVWIDQPQYVGMDNQ